MTYSRLNTINTYVAKLKNKEIEFSQIRSKLEKLEINEEEIKIVLRQVDREIQHIDLQNAQRVRGKSIFLGGLIASILGGGITIFSYLSVIDTGGYYISAYGPLIGGLGIMYKGRSMMK